MLKKDPRPIASAILLMAGAGERFGGGTPKQFHRLAGKKVYLHTLQTFLGAQLFDEIILVCHPDWKEEVQADLSSYLPAPIHIVDGGGSRQESSLNGLMACRKDTQIVVIHDAVRPFVTPQILSQNIALAAEKSAVDTCIPSADTLVFAPQNNQIASIPNRAEYLRGQTPQSFSYPLILKAHQTALAEGLKNQSDDCSLVVRLGHPIHVVLGSEENIKITTELDLFLAEQIYRLKTAVPLHPETSLAGKRFAVTGGTGGIGAVLCKLLKEAGAEPVILSRSQGTDLTSFAAAEHAFNAIGPIDGLINAIGLLKNKDLEELSADEIDQLVNTNLTSVIYSCKCAHIKKGGHIVNIASSSYVRGKKNYAIYSGAKAAVVNFTQGLSEERPDLCVNALVPQRTHTPMRLQNFPDEDTASLLDPIEVAKEILSLLKQSSLTGSIVEVRKK